MSQHLLGTILTLSFVTLSADNTRPDVGVKQRLLSPIIGLKNFNNWVKSVLISRFGHPVLASSSKANGFAGRGRDGGGRRNAQAGKVLDMGCGKGGDLNKWVQADVRELIGVGTSCATLSSCPGYALIATRPPNRHRRHVCRSSAVTLGGYAAWEAAGSKLRGP